jgi:O-antigen/teichoic acid export membrane protein
MPAAQSLQIIIWDVPVLMFASFCGNMTTVVGEERAAARIYIVSAIANILLNLYAIPRFSLIGASVVTVITDLIAALQFYFLLRQKLHLPDMKSVATRVVIASALMGIVVALISDRPLLVPIGAGVVIYSGLVLVLRVLDDAERSMIFRFLHRRGDSEAAKETIG